MARKLISIMMSVIMLLSMMLFTGCTSGGEAILVDEVYKSGNIEKDDLMHILIAWIPEYIYDGDSQDGPLLIVFKYK